MSVQVNFEDKTTFPAATVFEAIVNPEKLSKFFIGKASGPLVEGAIVHWAFNDFPVEMDITVKKVEADKRIVFEWMATGKPTEVDIEIMELEPGNTVVRIIETGWEMNEEGVAAALQQTQGWTDFFCCLEAYLLFNVDLRRRKKLGE